MLRRRCSSARRSLSSPASRLDFDAEEAWLSLNIRRSRCRPSRSTSELRGVRFATRSRSSSASSPPRSRAPSHGTASTSASARRAPRAARACSRWATSSGCATTWPSAWSAVRRQLHERAEAEEAKRELLERMLLEPGPLQVGPRDCRRARPGRLRRLPRPPPPGHRWHAHGVVARENLVRLSVIHLTTEVRILVRGKDAGRGQCSARTTPEDAARGGETPLRPADGQAFA